MRLANVGSSGGPKKAHVNQDDTVCGTGFLLRPAAGQQASHARMLFVTHNATNT
jgi:hypothetical protein